MKGEYKPFDKDLYSKHDGAKNVILDWLTSKGYTAMINPDKYGPDILIEDAKSGYEFFYVEVMQKMGWKGENFPFPDLNIEERKEKFLALGKPIIFAIVNADATHALMASGRDVCECPKAQVRNKNISSGELFFKVPKEMLTKIRIAAS